MILKDFIDLKLSGQLPDGQMIVDNDLSWWGRCRQQARPETATGPCGFDSRRPE